MKHRNQPYRYLLLVRWAIIASILVTMISFNIIMAESNINTKDEKGRTFLMVALQDKADMTEIISLLDQGADIHARNTYEATPLFFAVFHSKQAIIELLKRGADINARDDENTTPLMYVTTFARTANAELIHTLLDAGADIHAQDKLGKTALFFAASRSKETVQILLDAGANPNIQDIDGKTPLMEAVNAYHQKLSYEENLQLKKEITHLLINYRADITLKDKEYRNIADNARVKYYRTVSDWVDEGSELTDEEEARANAEIEILRLFAEYIKQLYEKHTGTVLPPL